MQSNSLVVSSTLPPPVFNALTTPNLIKGQAQEVQLVQDAIAITNQTLKPSTLAGIEGPLYRSVQNIDDMFIIAIENYKKRLINASAEDLAIESAGVMFPTLYAGCIGSYKAVLNFAPNISVIREVCVPILAFFGFFWGMLKTKNINEEKKEEDKSINRKMWAAWVSIEDKKMIEDCLTLIKRRVQVLAVDITESNNQGLLEQDAIDEVRQIATVIQAISGNELTVNVNENQMSVGIFLEQFV